jgi:two-component system chemotaxis response regulator CheB
MAGLIKVLIVDDSAFVRKMIKAMLSRSAFIEVVGIAFDGAEALELIPKLNPDVVTLDLMMPKMDGVEFLREQMARRPLPVVVVTIAAGNSDQVVAALAAGAIDFIQKPTALASEELLEIADQLIAKVKMAATVKFSMASVTDSATKSTSNTAPALTFDFPIKHPVAIDLVAIGISTGGPSALSQVIPQLPADFPVPIAIVLHMLEGYTKPYAERIDRESSLKVMEAQEGDLLSPGMVVIARAGQHLKIIRDAQGQLRTHLSLIPSNTIHRPSVDVLF